jgi:hypothetical protein
MLVLEWNTWQRLNLLVEVIDAETSSTIYTFDSLKPSTVVRQENISQLSIDTSDPNYFYRVKVANQQDRFPDGRPHLFCHLFKFSHGDVIKLLPTPREGEAVICECF